MANNIVPAVLLVSMLASTVRMASPIILAAMGELTAERGGVMNLSVEGTMLVGAFVAFYVSSKSGNALLAIAAAILCGGLLSALMAFMSITQRLNQTIVGLALNLFASGITFFLYRVSYNVQEALVLPQVKVLDKLPIPLLSDIPYVGEILFSQNIYAYLAFIAVPIVWLVLYKTKIGLLIRAAGEMPRAVDVRGVSVLRLRYLTTIFGGLMAGLAGSFLTVGSAGLFVQDISAGRGWLAVVAVIAGNWMPWRTLAACLVFAFFDALQLQLQAIGFQVPYQLFLSIPYVAAVILMLGTRAMSRPPARLGVPYVRE